VIWTAVFLICSPAQCISIGSLLFEDQQTCEFAVKQYGISAVLANNPSHKILTWKCVSFNEVEENA